MENLGMNVYFIPTHSELLMDYSESGVNAASFEFSLSDFTEFSDKNICHYNIIPSITATYFNGRNF